MNHSTTTGHEVALLSPAVGTGNVGDHFIERAIVRFLRDDVTYHRISVRSPLTANDIAVINSCNCAILCGTNLYQHDWESALSAEALARVKVPVIPFGVGGSATKLSDRDVSRTTREMIHALHASCVVGSVRDPFSAEVVAGAGVTNVLVTGCPVLFWAQRDELAVPRPGKRRRIVVTARNWLMHRWPDNVDHPVQLRLLETVIRGFRAEEIVFAVHEDFDERLVERLNLLPANVVRGGRPEDFVRIYSDPQNVVLALRLHAGMIAVANGVPAIFVGHDTRTHSFCEMMGLRAVEMFAENAAAECLTRLRRILEGDVSEFVSPAAPFRTLRSTMHEFLAANRLPVREPATGRPSEPVVAGRGVPSWG
jgi:polysaccharide pyruvyl transferase WcaK-like protein